MSVESGKRKINGKVVDVPRSSIYSPCMSCTEQSIRMKWRNRRLKVDFATLESEVYACRDGGRYREI